MSTEERPGLHQPMIGALLREASDASHRLLFARLRAAGYDELRDSHFALFKFPGPHGLRPTELADHVGLSKQALNPLLNDLETFGYLTRQPGEGDGRHKVLLLTERGSAFLAEAKAILDEVEAQLAEQLGARQMASLRSMLRQLPSLLEATPEPRRRPLNGRRA